MGKDGQQDSSFFKNSFLQVILLRAVVLKLLNASESPGEHVKTQLARPPFQSFSPDIQNLERCLRACISNMFPGTAGVGGPHLENHWFSRFPCSLEPAEKFKTIFFSSPYLGLL